jgi:acyl-coenzyme A thioesterase PaaI-like protein
MSDPLPPPDGFEPHPDRGFIDLVGPFWIRRDPEGTAFGFRAEPKHANLIGVVQGGMLMTFADRAMGITAWDAAGGRVCVTVQFGMHFVSSARMGEFVTLRPEVVKRTNSMVFMTGTLAAGERVVGVANGIWKILEGRSPV